jgi:tetratricopeptide (TPR) repeat protein
MADLEEACAMSPGSIDVVIACGVELMRANRFDDAIHRLGDAIVLDPSSARAFSNRGAAKRFGGDLRGARADLLRAVSLDPSTERAHYNLGVVLELSGEADEAERAYDRAIELDGDLADCRYRRAGIRISRANSAGALLDMREAMRLRPDDHAYLLRRALAALDLDRPSAETDLGRYLTTRPDDAPARFALGYVLQAQSRFDNADAELTRALAIRPDWAEPWALRAETRLRQGKADAAIDDASRAIALDPALADAYRTRSEALARRGDEVRSAADLAIYSELSKRRP